MGNEISTILIGEDRKVTTYGKIYSLTYGISKTPFGQALFVWSRSAVCLLTFAAAEPEKTAANFAARRPDATLNRDDTAALHLAERIFAYRRKPPEIRLLLRGTGFQLKIWQTLLLHTKPGQTISYSRLAAEAGFPRAQRAVGSAMAANPIAFLIPCHRVIRNDGRLGNYRWGSAFKQKILDWEKSSA